MEKLNLTAFERALNSLKSVLKRYNEEKDIDLRDSIIQRFEYTYAIALKIIVRFINLQGIKTQSIMTFNEIIRTANQYGLLKSNLIIWDNYRKIRNMTSHTYDEEIANKVLEVIPDFIIEIEFLFTQLKTKI